jgi:hypothetical protein
VWVIKWEAYIRQRLIEFWKFIVCDGIESEDAVSICNEFYKYKTNIVLAYLDKDLHQIEGNRFDYSKHQHWYTDKFGKLELIQKSKSKKLSGTGLMWLYAQYCLGDKTDNIPNLKKGCGDVYVYNLLKDCTTELQLMNKVYQEFLKHSSREAFILNRTLVKMLDKPMYNFMIPEVIEYKKVEINIFEL